jgi:hypothetical protein
MCARPRPACGAPILAGVAGTRGEDVTAAGRTSLRGKPAVALAEGLALGRNVPGTIRA